MRPVATLPVPRDVSEDEAIETRMIRNGGASRCERKEDNPRDKPYREKNASGHAKEGNKKVRIQAICVLD